MKFEIDAKSEISIPIEKITAPGLVFSTQVSGKIFRGLVSKVGASYAAFKNECQHLPITLDPDNGEVLDDEKKHFQCHMHGALYELSSGHCVGGPCFGASLPKLASRVENKFLIVTICE